MEINDIIKKRLNSIEVDINDLKDNAVKRIIQIEEYGIEKKSQRETALKTLSDSSFTVKSIASAVNCSRTTIYKDNQMLKKYIDKMIEEYDKDNVFSEIEKLKTENALLLQRIALMENRDLDFELLKNENKSLKSRLKDKINDNTRLRAALEKMAKDKR